MRKSRLCLYLLLIIFSQSYTISILNGEITGKGSCRANEYWNKKGFCCDKCHRGFKLKKECPAQGMRSECEKCEEGTYLDKENFNGNCFRCQECKKPHSKEISSCTFQTDRVCGCDKGFYKNKLGELEWSCQRCKDCGPGQMEIRECSSDGNRQCICKDNHYPVSGKNSCLPCVECDQQECYHYCKSSIPLTPNPPYPVRTTKPTTDTVPQILVPICACTFLAVVVFMVYEALRLWRKRRRALSSQSSSPALQDKTLIITVEPDKENESIPLTNSQSEPDPQRNLPDCVPREIKIHEFFYFVLEEVPIGRFKELVRRLGVSEQSIDRAEQDHRTSKDAHYQMLKVWSDSGSGGGNNVLPGHRIQMFINTLKDMHLVSCADNIENKFLLQETSAS